MLAGAIAALVLVLAMGGVAWQSGMFAQPPNEVFALLAAEYEESVFLVEAGVTLPDGDYVMLGTGTAFAAAEGGYLITNKHVVLPHQYDPAVGCLEEAYRRLGFDIADNVQITVWPGGSVFRQATDNYGDLGLGYSTTTETLRLMARGSDNRSRAYAVNCSDYPLSRRYGVNFSFDWQRHDQDNADLAVLRIDASPKPFPLAQRDPASDDPVMVYGFPRGLSVLEGINADPVRRVGTVIRSEETIQTDAIVQGGNSGGPLINLQGEVVGITTRGTDDSLFNMALKISYARILLERAM